MKTIDFPVLGKKKAILDEKSLDRTLFTPLCSVERRLLMEDMVFMPRIYPYNIVMSDSDEEDDDVEDEDDFDDDDDFEDDFDDTDDFDDDEEDDDFEEEEEDDYDYEEDVDYDDFEE